MQSTVCGELKCSVVLIVKYTHNAVTAHGEVWV